MRSLLSLILFILWAERGGCFYFFFLDVGGEGWGGGLEQFKECVANEDGPSFQKTQIGWRKIVLLFKKKT